MQNGLPQLESRLVTNLKFPLIMAVVLIHCYLLNGSENMSAISQLAPLTSTVMKWLQNQVYTVAVPLFYFLSGYLFFRNGVPDWAGYKSKWRSRVKTLLLPYILWNLAGLVLFVVKVATPLSSQFPQYQHLQVGLPLLLQGFWGLSFDGHYPFDFVLWFLRNLIIAVALSPAIGWLIRKGGIFSVLIFLIVGWLGDSWTLGITTGIYFFALGAFVSVKKFDIGNIGKYGAVLLCVWLLSTVCSECFAGINRFLILQNTLGVFAAIAVGWFFTIRGKNVSPLLSRSTFFIYAFHGLYATVAVRVAMTVLKPQSDLTAAGTYLLAFVLEAGGAFVVYLFMNRFLPRLTKILTGGR